MTLPSYPAELPRPLAPGYQVARGEGRTVMRQDAGPSNIRRRFSSVVDTVNFSTMLDRAQLARFDRFYDEDTKGGSLPFLIADPGTEDWALLDDDGVSLLTEDSVPLQLAETWVVTFGQTLPTRTNVALTWTVSFTLLALPS